MLLRFERLGCRLARFGLAYSTQTPTAIHRPSVAGLVIGNEILAGSTLDSNGNYLGTFYFYYFDGYNI
jgi:hypothetical protein